MKVRAIRVAEFGRFRDGVALENLSGALDVLIGPNEIGKSTLFTALELALFDKHRTSRKELVGLRPYGGGAPRVEVEVELCGEPWRLRKRFLSAHAAELVSLRSGSVARGSDAEDKLQRLLAESGAVGGRELLWPKQGALLDPGDLPPPGGDVLRVAIDREVSTAAGGHAVRRVRDVVREALASFVTAKQQRPRGPFQAALDAVARATSEWERAQAEFKAGEELLDRLATLEAERERRTNAQVQAALQKAVTDAEARLQSAHRDIAGRDAARLALSEARAVHQAASTQAKRIADGLSELEKLECAARDDAGRSEALTPRLLEAEASAEAAEAARRAARDAVDAVDAAMRHAAAVARWRELSARVDRAEAAADRIRGLVEEMRGLPLDERPVREARGLAARIAENTARLEAASAAVTVHYVAGAEARLQVDGRTVVDGERLLAVTPLVLDIPGLGRVEIEPGASRDRDRIEADLARDRSALQKLLMDGAVTAVAELEARHTLARRLAAELDAAKARADAIAPEGLAALRAALEVAVEEAGDRAGAEDGESDPKALAAALSAARAELQKADEVSRARVAERDELRRAAIALQARSAERRDRLAALAASLPAPDERAAQLEQARAQAHRASVALDDALRLERMASEKAPDQDTMQRIEDDVARARNAYAALRQLVSSFEKDRARIEGELEAARREDIVMRLAETEREVERTRSERDSLAEEVQALQLLEAELGAEEERLRDSYLAPVMARLGPYIQAVFPDAELTLGSGYAIEALRRGVHAEDLDRLSDGTREQLAVLVRLAFARLLADQGLEVPLVLDDALVFSDDLRIAAMHRALEKAALSHQVIVLSCREQSFRGLGGNRVELVPWQFVPF